MSAGASSRDEAGSTIQRRVFVSGRVQGVGFRESTVREAARVGELGGFVRNLSDGRVEALFVGPQDQVLKMIAWCRTGPASARVEAIEVIEEPLSEPLTGFSRR